MTIPSRTSVVVATLLAWFAFATSANAYVDSGSIAIVFQSIVAALAAGGMFFKVFKQRITGFFSRGAAADGDEPTTTTEAPAPTASAAVATSASTADAAGETDADR